MMTARRISAEQREKMISEAAYYAAQKRGFVGGDPVGDWLDAERKIDAKFRVAPHDKKLEELYERLSEVNERLGQATKRLKAGARKEWADDVERVHELRDSFAAQLEAVRESTGQAKQQAKRQAEKLWHTLTEAVKRLAP